MNANTGAWYSTLCELDGETNRPMAFTCAAPSVLSTLQPPTDVVDGVSNTETVPSTTTTGSSKPDDDRTTPTETAATSPHETAIDSSLSTNVTQQRQTNATTRSTTKSADEAAVIFTTSSQPRRLPTEAIPDSSDTEGQYSHTAYLPTTYPNFVVVRVVDFYQSRFLISRRTNQSYHFYSQYRAHAIGENRAQHDKVARTLSQIHNQSNIKSRIYPST